MSESRIQRLLIAIAVLIVMGQWVRTMCQPDGDFVLHWKFGQHLHEGRFLYDAGHNPYPPVWAVPHVPFSLLPLHVAKPAFFLVGLLSSLFLLWILHDLTRSAFPLTQNRLFWVYAAVLLITSRFVTRDLDDGGQNLTLLMLTWLGIWFCVRQRPVLAGGSLGLAMALKCTAGLFLLYFLLKRQWRLAGACIAWTGLFMLTPVCWQGWASYQQHMACWLRFLQAGMQQTDPATGVLGAELLQNRALRPSLARFLMTLPEGHPGRYPGTGHIDFLDLTPTKAGILIKCIMIALVLSLGWVFRAPAATHDTMTYVWEAAVVSLLALLYSPITWTQHCVAVLPSIFLLVRSWASGQRTSLWIPASIVAFALVVLGTNRAFVGHAGTLLMDSYHVVTCAIVGLIAVMTRFHPTTIQRQTSSLLNPLTEFSPTST